LLWDGSEKSEAAVIGVEGGRSEAANAGDNAVAEVGVLHTAEAKRSDERALVKGLLELSPLLVKGRQTGVCDIDVRAQLAIVLSRPRDVQLRPGVIRRVDTEDGKLLGMYWGVPHRSGAEDVGGGYQANIDAGAELEKENWGSLGLVSEIDGSQRAGDWS